MRRNNISSPFLMRDSGVSSRRCDMGVPGSYQYSDALKSSGIVWDDRSLDGWLTDPDRMIPENEMPFNGIKNPPGSHRPACFSERGHQTRRSTAANRTGADGRDGRHDERNDGGRPRP